MPLFFLIFELQGASGYAVKKSASPVVQNKRENQSPFRYIIIYNEVESGKNVTFPRRTVSVLLDDKAFSEENLIELFKLISIRFPKPKWMHVDVYTSLEQIPTPEEEDFPRISNSEGNPALDTHHRAIFYREYGEELIRYNPDPPSVKMKSVVIKKKK